MKEKWVGNLSGLFLIKTFLILYDHLRHLKQKLAELLSNLNVLLNLFLMKEKKL